MLSILNEENSVEIRYILSYSSSTSIMSSATRHINIPLSWHTVYSNSWSRWIWLWSDTILPCNYRRRAARLGERTVAEFFAHSDLADSTRVWCWGGWRWSWIWRFCSISEWCVPTSIPGLIEVVGSDIFSTFTHWFSFMYFSAIYCGKVRVAQV